MVLEFQNPDHLSIYKGIEDNLSIKVDSIDQAICLLEKYAWKYTKANLIDSKGFLKLDCRRKPGGSEWTIRMPVR